MAHDKLMWTFLVPFRNADLSAPKKVTLDYSQSSFLIQPACEARQRTYALRALRLLLADSALTVGRGKTF